WQRIEEKAKSSQTPRLLHKDMGLASSVIRDLFSPDIDRLLVDSRNQYAKISKYLKDVAPSLVSKLDLYKGKKPIFDAMGIEDEIDKSLSRKIWIKGGGHIIFDQTEALMVVDVNSGRSVREKDHEKNALQTDLEAARTIARQLRLRDSGGIIVIDFIDLEKEANRRKVVDTLKRELGKDRASFDVLPMNDFGLVSLTRERVRPSLLYRYSEPCPRCSGMGRVPARSTLVTKIERSIHRIKSTTGQRRFILYLHPEMAAYMTSGLRSLVRLMMIKFFVTLRVEAKPELREEEFELASFKGEKFDSYSFSS
ncbi:MAG TPA: ribonuclease E/G, partial [bacterium]|nr:ribonuclease E/G [bacterium]